MARYIDAEQFRGKHEVAEINGKLCSVIPYADIVYAPPADVAPKSEVAMEIFEEIEKQIIVYLYGGTLHRKFAELKKKYTGENNNA